MELEGISNACRINVIIKSPVTSTPASDARNSTVVSLGLSFGVLLSMLSFFANLMVRSDKFQLRGPDWDMNQFTSRKVRFQRVI